MLAPASFPSLLRVSFPSSANFLAALALAEGGVSVFPGSFESLSSTVTADVCRRRDWLLELEPVDLYLFVPVPAALVLILRLRLLSSEPVSGQMGIREEGEGHDTKK